MIVKEMLWRMNAILIPGSVKPLNSQLFSFKILELNIIKIKPNFISQPGIKRGRKGNFLQLFLRKLRKQ